MKVRYLVNGLWGVAAAAPVVALMFVIAKHAYDFPFQDQWYFVPDVDKCYSGTLTFHDLWRQHNEHRIFFPRIVMLILARLTSWSNVAEAWLNAAAGGAIFLAMVVLLRKLARASNQAFPWWLAFVASCLAFSCNQVENWLWGWQIQIFMNILFVILGVVALHMDRFSRSRFAAAIALGILASYSFSNGVFFWAALLPSVWAIPADDVRRRAVRALTWLGIGAVVFALYLYGYAKPDRHPSLTLALQHPGDYCMYVLSFLGSLSTYLLVALHSARANVWGSTIIGAIGLIVFGAAVIAHIRSKRAGAPAVAACVSLALYALLSALVTGIGRVGFGPGQATTSRYTTISNLFWLACIALVYLLSAGGQLRRGLRFGAVALLGVFLIVQQAGAVYAVRYYAVARHAQALSIDAVRAGSNEPLFLSVVCPTEPELVPQYRPILEAKRLSIFARPLKDREALSETFRAEGDAYAAARGFDSAEAFYRASLTLNPANAAPALGLAMVKFDRKDWPGAEQALRDCLRAQPGDADLHSTLGVTLARERKFDEALAEFAKARELLPSSPVSYINEAAVRVELSQFSAGAALYQEALRLDPSNTAAQMALTALRARAGTTPASPLR